MPKKKQKKNKTRNAQAYQKPPTERIVSQETKYLCQQCRAACSLSSIHSATVQTYISIPLHGITGDTAPHCKLDTNLYTSVRWPDASSCDRFQTGEPQNINLLFLLIPSDHTHALISWHCPHVENGLLQNHCSQSFRTNQLFCGKQQRPVKTKAFPVLSLPHVCSSY